MVHTGARCCALGWPYAAPHTAEDFFTPDEREAAEAGLWIDGLAMNTTGLPPPGGPIRTAPGVTFPGSRLAGNRADSAGGIPADLFPRP